MQVVVGYIIAANSSWEQGRRDCILYLTKLLHYCDPGISAGSADQCILVDRYLRPILSQ